MGTTEQVGTLVIGGGQAGLSVGHHLAQRGVSFTIVDADERIGDQWRRRWDSLRLFTPARYDGLDGMPYPSDPGYFPTKDEFADYLEHYARTFDLPVRSGVRVQRLSATEDGGYLAETDGGGALAADQVVVAMGGYQRPRTPAFAAELDPDVVQVHAGRYQRPAQLQPGATLVVGAGNSGAEIAMDLVRDDPDREVVVAGRDVGQIPFRIAGRFGRAAGVPLVVGWLFHRVFTIDTRPGRVMRHKVLTQGGPLIRVRRSDLARRGVELTDKVAGVENGQPVLEDGRVLDVANVVWCTGFDPGLEWIDLPIHAGHAGVTHEAGVVPSQPGLFFVGLPFLYSLSSAMVNGVGRDAARIADHVAGRVAGRPVAPISTSTSTADWLPTAG